MIVGGTALQRPSFSYIQISRTKYVRIVVTNYSNKLVWRVNTHMVQLFPGLLYVFIITVIFTVLLVSFTAASLLSQARAIVRKRYIGSVFSKRNVKKIAKRHPVLATMTAMLLNLKDVESNRLLTTFKRPAAMRLYQKCLYVKPYFSSGAYLIQNSDIKAVSIVNSTLNVTFMQEDRIILLQCRGYNLLKWRDSLNALILNHK